MKPLINILIRTSNRPDLFKRCLQSIYDQNYPNVRIIVSVDNDLVDYIPDGIETIRVQKNNLEFGYDLYINSLKGMVNDGYFFCLDDDDTLTPNVLNELVLDAPAILVQISHLDKLYPPKDKQVVNGNVIEIDKISNIGPGQVGFPCLILHHSLKNLADIKLGDKVSNDYVWISEIQSKVELKFQPIILVVCDQKGNGCV
ncbi:MAG: glycosyltransferase family A protein [Candidatus Babeliales bacterium]|nr:glycosyltransferase family A protein [Candidatus Babeliales bacterium]